MPDVRPTEPTTLMVPSSKAIAPSGIFSRNSPHTRAEWSLSEGPQGTFEALALMRSAVRGEVPPDFSGYKDPYIKAVATRISESAHAKQGSIDGAYAIFYWVRDGIFYYDHKPEEQVVQDAKRTIEIGSGDCVSQSVLLATLLAAAGYRPQFAVQMPSVDEGFTHVYVDLLFGDHVVALDPIADGLGGRSLGSAGWSQLLPDMGFECSIPIF